MSVIGHRRGGPPAGVEPLPRRTRITSPVPAPIESLQLAAVRRLDGLLAGDHAGLFPGHGTERGEARPYVPGDDPRHIDWAVTARTNDPHVRDTIADHELELWLVLDTSSSHAFGTGRSTKHELAWTRGRSVRPARQPGRQPHRCRRLRQGRTTDPRPIGPCPHGRSADGAAHPTGRWRRRRSRQGDPPRPQGRQAPRHGDRRVRLPRRADLGAVAARPHLTARGDRRAGERPSRVRTSRRGPDRRRRPRDRSPTGRRHRRPRACGSGTRRSLPAGRPRSPHASPRLGADHLVLRTDRDWVLDLVRFVGQRRTRRRTASAAARPLVRT